MSIDKSSTSSPFCIKGAINTKLPAPVDRLVESTLAKISGLDQLDHFYKSLPESTTTLDFLDKVLDTFSINYQVDSTAYNPVLPEKGPVVIVANHPFGGLEGVILARHFLKQRKDVKFMANYFLSRIPELSDLFIGVDPFGSAASQRTNIRPIREALHWLQEGGVLVVFPAGEVSHLHPVQKQITDPAWSPSIARIIKLTDASVIPYYFHGANSNKFQILGLVHARLRTALLPRELMNKKQKKIEIRAGKLIKPRQMKGFKNDKSLIQYLRLRTYALEKAFTETKVKDRASISGNAISEANSKQHIIREIDALPESQKLVENNSFSVFYASADQITITLQEIGRLREITFRETGEGTGKASDNDLFDAYYLHLVLWDKEQQQIAGGYRLGLADEIFEKYGKKGLYTAQLFHYRSSLLRRLPPAIELGRSYICPDYQKSYSPLLLLWKGIGAFIQRHPKYRILFGPVSISNEYTTYSQQLLVDFLRVNRYQDVLSRKVRPKNPFRQQIKKYWRQKDIELLEDVDRLSDVISQIECDDKGVPVLLKQYLKLGGRLLGFNVDPEFNHAIDGLIMVDLLETDVSTLQKYMGKQEGCEYLAYHDVKSDELQKAS